jgi:hypothetical protein
MMVAHPLDRASSFVFLYMCELLLIHDVERFSFGGGMDRDKSLDKKIPSDER